MPTFRKTNTYPQIKNSQVMEKEEYRLKILFSDGPHRRKEQP